MLCKDCRFWGTYIDGACDRVGTGGWDQSKNPQHFYIEASAADDHGLETFLITGPEFGCVLFESEEKSNE